RQSDLVCRSRRRGDPDRRHAVARRRVRPRGAGAHRRSLPAHLARCRNHSGQDQGRAHLFDTGDDARGEITHEAAKPRGRTSARPFRGRAMNVLRPAKIVVGIVVERRKAQSPWIDFTWKPVAALPGQPDALPWTTLAEEGETTTFYAGAAEITLYR